MEPWGKEFCIVTNIMYNRWGNLQILYHLILVQGKLCLSTYWSTETHKIHNTGSVPVLGLSKIGQNFENAKTCNFSAKIGHDSENLLIRS